MLWYPFVRMAEWMTLYEEACEDIEIDTMRCVRDLHRDHHKCMEEITVRYYETLDLREFKDAKEHLSQDTIGRSTQINAEHDAAIEALRERWSFQVSE